MSSPKRRVAAYCRVSTALQTGGLESQVRAINLHFQNNNIDGFDFYIDEGISGTKANRPNLDRMMAAVRRGEISAVVCYSFSRFARSVTHLLLALEEMNKHNVAFLSLTEKIETNSPMGRAFFVVIAAISHYAESGIMWSELCKSQTSKQLKLKPTPHNYYARREEIRASGALNLPRLSSGGTTASIASSFSDGSILR